MSTHEERYLKVVAELQELSKQIPSVTLADILDIAAMSREELQRRALIGRGWHDSFSHCLDNLKEISCMPGAGIDGCRGPGEIRSIVETLIQHCPVTWQKGWIPQPKKAESEEG